MAVTPVGTPAAIQRSTSGATGVTGSWGTGQNRTAGNMLVALVSAGGATASAAAISTPSGWTQAETIGNTTSSANAWVAIYWKVAAGSDSAPSFTSTLSGTQAMTCTLLELSGCHNGLPVQAFGTYSSGGSSGTLSAMTASTGLNPTGGSYAVAIFCQEAAAATNSWNSGGSWANVTTDGTTSSVLHTAVDVYQAPPASANVSETGHWTTNTSAFGAAIVLVIHPPSGLVLYSADVPSTSVSSGGTTAPASGTVETWTVASSTGFPAVSNSTVPPTRCFVADPLLPGENIEIISQISSTSWLVVRGADGSTPVSHTAGFTVYQVVNAGSLGDLPQEYNVRSRRFGAAGDGSTDDTTAIMLAVNTCVANGGGVVRIPAGTYSVSSTLNWKLTGLTVVGDGSDCTIISMSASNTPIVQFAGDYQRISGINFKYATQQTTSNTSAIAAEFGDDTVGSCFMSRFADLIFTYSYIGMAINPAVSVVAGMFSCLFEDIQVNYYAHTAIYLVGSNGSGANCTGCVFVNTYTQNGNSAANSWPVFLEYWDEVTFHQLNIEHVSLASADALALVNVGNAVLAGVHFEEVTQSADTYGLIYTSASSAASKTTCYGVTCRFSTFSGATYNSVFRFFGTNGASLVVDGYLDDSSNTLTAPARYAADFNSATNVTAYLRSFSTTNVTAQQANASTADVVAQYNDTATYTGSSSLAGLTIASGSLLGTAAAGAVENDGTAFYATSVASSRQVVDAEQFLCLSSSYTLANSTAAQKLFNVPSAGSLTVQGSTMYWFECQFDLSGTSTSSHSISFGFGGTATFTSIKYGALCNSSAVGTTSTPAWGDIVSASATVLLSAVTTATGMFNLRGVMRISAGGTIIPQITLSVANTTSVVAANSYFRIWPAGSGSVTSVGNWS